MAIAIARTTTRPQARRAARIVLAFAIAATAAGVATLAGGAGSQQAFAAERKPAAVKSVKAQAKNSSSVKVTWRKTKGATKFQVRYSTKKSMVKAVKKSTSKKKTITVSALKAGTVYYFQARAKNARGWGKWSAKAKCATQSGPTQSTAQPTPAPSPEPTPTPTPTPAETYTITYNLDGGTLNDPVTSYTSQTNTFSLPQPTKDGSTFKGWYTNSDFSGEAVTEITKGSTGDLTFYAKWDGRTAFAVYCKDDSSLNFYKRDKVPTVSSTFDDKPVTAVYTGFENATYSYAGSSQSNTPWNALRNAITSVCVVDEGIQPINTSYWFYQFTALTSADVNKLDTSKVTCMERMFSDDKELTMLDLDEWDTSSLISAELMFDWCTSLEDVYVSTWDTSALKNMRCMFHQCEALKNIDVKDWDTSNLESMSQAFSECSSLSVLNVSKWNTGSIINMSMAFSGCSSIHKINVASWNTSKVTDMSWIFNNCSSLSKLDITKWDTSKVECFDALFNGCTKLAELDLSKWDMSNAKSTSAMFKNCTGLTKLDLTKWDMSNVTTLSSMFSGCTGLTELDLSEWATGSFRNLSDMFLGCTGLAELDLSNWDVSNVTNMNGMFSGCTGLYTINALKWNTSKATSMERLFLNCKALSQDCRKWDVSSVKGEDWNDKYDTISKNNNTINISGTGHEDFNTNAPYVLAPEAWGSIAAVTPAAA